MITGTLYINLVDGSWITAPARLLGPVEGDPTRVRIEYFPEAPTQPVTPTAVLTVTATASLVAPTEGEYVYVAD
jgi:hypothetical protein